MSDDTRDPEAEHPREGDPAAPVHRDESVPASEKSTVTKQPPAGKASHIGPYRLIQKAGEGGMGEVWHAEQTEPIRRRVALKIIKQGMDTRQIIARFEQERQALALMNHPCVAKVFDAGSTPEGRPYFVMEYVQGLPITEHCDRHRLTTEERLELFVQVCEGVQHAHHKAIIHRDLKPSNVLVTMEEGKATPKIIDFGVAKATAQPLTEKSLFTELGVLIGTPEYMSPEQADLTAQDIDTRTDVYSLGAILYELLVGALPFDSKELRQAGFDGIRRRIREQEPSRPSARLGALGGEATTESARRRRVDARTLRRQLSGDLDWITMKALEKDRQRRYGSPAELAADIARHLTHQPVAAGPPSAAYRAGKFVRRHRFGVAATTVGVIALLVFATAMGLQLRRTARERQRAEQVSRFLTSLFSSANPRMTAGKEVSLRQVLDQGAARIDTELAGEPEIQASLLHTIGGVYLALGLYDNAEPLLTRAMELRQRLLGHDHPDTLRSETSMALLYQRQGRHVSEQTMHQDVLERRRRVLGEDHPDTLWSMHNVAASMMQQGRYAEAESLHREVLGRRRRALGEDHPDTLSSMTGVANSLSYQGRYAEAEPLYREVLEKRRRILGEDHPDTLSSMESWANDSYRFGKFAEVEPIFREVLEKRRRILGEDHPDTLRSMGAVANCLVHEGHYAEAEPLFREALDKSRRVLGEDHRRTLGRKADLARNVGYQGNYVEAGLLFQEVLETQRRFLGEDHPDLGDTMYDIACLASLRGDRAKAIDWLNQAVDHGFGDAKGMAEDDDLKPLHGSPEFEAILAAARKNEEQASGIK